MGDQIYKLAGGLDIPVQPSNELVESGWLPGTWVKLKNAVATITPGALAVVDKSDGTGIIAGILMTGPQHRNPVRQLSDMWNADSIQVAGGDTHADWTGIDAGGPLIMDKNKTLQRLGGRVVTMALTQETVWKNYVFETEGGGGALTYTIGDKLYVSSNGLTTKFREDSDHVWTGYVVASVGTDYQGDYIIMIGAIG